MSCSRSWAQAVHWSHSEMTLGVASGQLRIQTRGRSLARRVCDCTDPTSTCMPVQAAETLKTVGCGRSQKGHCWCNPPSWQQATQIHATFVTCQRGATERTSHFEGQAREYAHCNRHRRSLVAQPHRQASASTPNILKPSSRNEKLLHGTPQHASPAGVEGLPPKHFAIDDGLMVAALRNLFEGSRKCGFNQLFERAVACRMNGTVLASQCVLWALC